MADAGLAFGLTAFAVSAIISWPIVIVGWSLPENVFERSRLTGASWPQMLIVALLPSLATLWAIMTLPAVALPGAMMLAWGLICLSVVDARTFVLPDCLTLPLIPAGLVHAAVIAGHLFGVAEGVSTALQNTVAAGVAYVIMAIIAWSFHKLRKKEGLGLGDAKLFAVAGAWLGSAALPSVLLLAAVMALIVTFGRACLVGGSRLDATAAIPFGPYLAAGLWIVFLHGPLAFN